MASISFGTTVAAISTLHRRKSYVGVFLKSNLIYKIFPTRKKTVWERKSEVNNRKVSVNIVVSSSTYVRPKVK